MPALDRPTETAVDELARRARAAGLGPHAAEALALDCVLALRAQGWRPTTARAAEEWRPPTTGRRAGADTVRARAAEVRALLDQITHRTGDHR